MEDKEFDILQRIQEYDKDWCYQYDIRLKTFEEDKEMFEGLGYNMADLRVGDFTFEQVIDKDEKSKMIAFIKRYEWLGTISQYPTHWFAAYYKGMLGGVVIMNMPNAFSKLLGDNTKQIERLISRGACASWTPKNLASAFLSWSMKWMVKNTNYRLFTCYSDPQAHELGSIYQALNAFYLGKGSGTNSRYINPYSGKLVSDRFFRVRSAYKRYAKDLGIEWNNNGLLWNNDQKMLWENIPDEIEKQLRDYSKEIQKNSKKIEFPSKHKYAFVFGRDNREQKALRKIFLERNKIHPYPKKRGE